MPIQQKGGKQKRYGPKMASPRIAKSKEQRNCGPLGRYIQYKRWLEDPKKFDKPTAKHYSKFSSKITRPVIEIRKKKRLQIGREELINYFGL